MVEVQLFIKHFAHDCVSLYARLPLVYLGQGRLLLVDLGQGRLLLVDLGQGRLLLVDLVREAINRWA